MNKLKLRQGNQGTPVHCRSKKLFNLLLGDIALKYITNVI